MSTVPPPADAAQPVRVPISKRLVLINSASGIATRLLTVGVFAWAIQYLMKRIPEAELALLPIVLSLAMVLPVLQTILTGGLSRFVTEAYARNDLAGITRIVSSQFPLLLLGSMLIALLGGSVAWNIDHILDIPPSLVGKARFMMLLIVGRVTIGMALAPFNTGLYANQRFVLQNAIDIASSLLRISLMIGFILGIGPRVEWVIMANILSQLFGQISGTIVSMRILPALRFRPASFDWATCKRVLSFSGWDFISQSANLIRRAADAPILYLFSTPVAVNNFFLGSLFETQLRQIAITASQPLMPVFTAMHANQQNTRLAGAYLRGGRIALWAAMLLAVPLMIFSYDISALYLGSNYQEHRNAATVMVLLLFGFPFTYPTMVFQRIAYAKGKIRPMAIRALVGQSSNLVLTLVLVKVLHLGAIGCAIATLLTYAIGHPFLYWTLAMRMLQITHLQFFQQLLLPGLFPALAAGGVGALAHLFIDTTVLRIAVGVPSCLVAYTIGVLIMLKPADRADLMRLRRRVWA